MDAMDIMDSFFIDLCTVWTQWTKKYAVDTSAAEWGARGQRFISRLIICENVSQQELHQYPPGRRFESYRAHLEEELQSAV